MSTYEKEFLAVVVALEKWRGYLLDRHFKIKTYHISLKYLMDQRMSTPTQLKWLPKLMGFDFVIVYKKGVDNVTADILSRIQNPAELLRSTITTEFYNKIVDSWDQDLTIEGLISKLQSSSNTQGNGYPMIRHDPRVQLVLKGIISPALCSSPLGFGWCWLRFDGCALGCYGSAALVILGWVVLVVFGAEGQESLTSSPCDKISLMLGYFLQDMHSAGLLWHDFCLQLQIAIALFPIGTNECEGKDSCSSVAGGWCQSQEGLSSKDRKPSQNDKNEQGMESLCKNQGKSKNVKVRVNMRISSSNMRRN
ncbi:putative mitochondrial protein [Tanacetum coccineum]